MSGIEFNRKVWSATRTVVVTLLLVITARVPAQSRLDQAAATVLAETSVRKTRGRDARSFLATERDDALESLFKGALTEPPKANPFMFRVSNEGEVRQGNVVTTHLSVHGPLVSVVAVSESGEVFQIKGARNSKHELENLNRRFGINLLSVNTASRYLEFYLRVNPENSLKLRLQSAAEVKELAKRQLEGQFGNEGSSSVERWWNEHATYLGSLDFRMDIVPSNGSFLVRYYSLSTAGAESHPQAPVLLRGALKVSKNGKISRVRYEPMWR